MSATALAAPRFVRRTQLEPHEYRKNFRQIDGDVIEAVTSREADAITPLMSKIYLKLVHAPAQYREREGVLHFTGEVRDDCHVTAWDCLCELVGVASATARKALQWMHEQGIIGYYSGKNGVGIRVFLNRASSSIGTKAGQKILEFPHASSRETHTSAGEAAFMDSFAVREVLDSSLNPRAPKSGAEERPGVKNQPNLNLAYSNPPSPNSAAGQRPVPHAPVQVNIPVDEIVSRLRRELEPALQSAARRAAAQEHERTREWLENRGLPKAARVAQREAFNVLRKYEVIRDGGRASHANVGCGHPIREHKLLSDGEVEELAQACVALLEVKGQSVELTLSEMSAEGGGFVLPADISRVRARADALLNDGQT